MKINIYKVLKKEVKEVLISLYNKKRPYGRDVFVISFFQLVDESDV